MSCISSLIKGQIKLLRNFFTKILKIISCKKAYFVTRSKRYVANLNSGIRYM